MSSAAADLKIAPTLVGAAICSGARATVAQLVEVCCKMLLHPGRPTCRNRDHT
jgi:hypothetical protein